MRSKLITVRDKYVAVLKPVFAILVRLPVRVEIWARDQRFLMFINNSVVGNPSIIGKLFTYQWRFWSVARKVWKEAYNNYSLQIYKSRNLAHYAKDGRGYVNLDGLSEQERKDIFCNLDSRLHLIVDAYPVTLGFKDGESFLDAGCGKGQNLRFIASRYPSSPYTGFDIDERCLEIAAIGVDGNSNRRLLQGSILDFEFLKSFPDKSADHVYASYVFSTLLESNTHLTEQIHQRVIDEFVRIARKSVVILDDMSLDRDVSVKIEQLTRATICENIAAYFSKHRSTGEACILDREGTYAALYKSTAS